MSRLYKTSDDAGAPKYLVDKLLDIVKEEMGNNNFDPMLGDVSRRRSFFPRVQRLLKIPAPEAITVPLETGEEVIVYRFDFAERFQRHLLSTPYSRLSNLSLPDPGNPWSSTATGVQAPTYSTTTQSQWYRDTSNMFHDQLASGHYMLHPICLYID